MAQKQAASETAPALEESTQGQDLQTATEPQEHERETKKLLNEFNFAKASKDGENGKLTPEQVQMFEGARRESAEESQTAINRIVERLSEHAEEVDRMFDRQMTEIVELTESTESAYEVFREVVTMLLAGEGRGAAGRLVALLCYCYRICKSHMTSSRTVQVVSVIAITGVVAGCLYKYLCEAKFFEWLEEIGGWNGLLRELADGLWDKTFGAVFRGVRYVCGGLGIGYGARAAATRGGRAVVRLPGEFVDVGRVTRRSTVVLFTRGSIMFYFRRATYSAVTSSYRNPVLAVGMISVAGSVVLYSYLREKLR